MSENSRIKLLVVDHHPVVRAGIEFWTRDENDIAIVGEAANGQDALKIARQIEVTMILMEIALNDRNGIDVLKQIKREFPGISLIIFSSHREDQYAIRALKAGASGFLTKNALGAELIGAIRQVASGLKFISPDLAQEMANNLNNEHANEPHKLLSDREYQTMIMIASGKSVSDIAKELSLSVKTISEYRSRILLKMKLRHNAELTHYAIKNELVE
ncbi:response regulator transcription factor [Undibacterium seohonense]|jgi:DNA-binding NarL/FixJ family response regulator|uniref:Response regulator transcription factor n=1 Tax=Undibacterium seohonense TaxID=1344950 RepID=A0ABR6X7W1_9BURK|nr:response regulator transcription factor [Undibacterium seohonense]MBC3809044.1 response regulator transcription factor [Undibacterium seohonense]